MSDQINADSTLKDKLENAANKNECLYSLLEENKKRHNDPKFKDIDQVTSQNSFEKYLFQAFEYHVWNHLNKIIFGQRHYEAYEDQKEYLMRQVVKPFGVAVDLAFRRIDVLCLLLERFPPPGSRDGTPSTDDWFNHQVLKKVENKEKRRMKFNLLPNPYQSHLQGLEQDWRTMSDSKFLAVTQEFEITDLADMKKAEAKRESLKRKKENASKNDNDDGDRRTKDNRQRKKRDRNKKDGDGSGTARFCQLCADAGAPDWVVKTHNAAQCRKKGKYSREEGLSNKSGLGSKKSQIREMRKLQKQFQSTMKKAFKEYRETQKEDTDSDDEDDISY
jgi:hypothetical protein